MFDPNFNTFAVGLQGLYNPGFKGGVLLPDGRVVFVPALNATIGLFDPSTNSFTGGPQADPPVPDHPKFSVGVLLPDGRVVFVPSYTTKIGLFDPSTNTFTSGPDVGDINMFSGGVMLPDGSVVFVPYRSTKISLFHASSNTSTTQKPAYSLSQSLPPSWIVALLPYYNKV